jgi:hypothetical protein
MSAVVFEQECIVRCATQTCRNYGKDIPAKICFVEGKEPNVICGLCCARVAEIINTSEPVQVTD